MPANLYTRLLVMSITGGRSLSMNCHPSIISCRQQLCTKALTVTLTGFTNAVSFSTGREPMLGELKSHNLHGTGEQKISLLVVLMGPCGEEARSGSQQLSPLVSCSFCCVLRAWFKKKKSIGSLRKSSPNNAVRSNVILHLSIYHKALTFPATCLIPDSSSWESAESPISNQEGLVIFMSTVIGISGVMWTGVPDVGCSPACNQWLLPILAQCLPVHEGK